MDWATIAFSEEPETMEEALKGKDVKKWEITMQDEYKSLVVKNIWSLVPLPKGRKPISCRVLKIKHGVDGEIEHYKARLVEKGFTQTFGVDYNETFAHVANFVLIRCILALKTWRFIKCRLKLHFSMLTSKRSTWNNLKNSHKEMNTLCVSFTSHCMA